MDVYKESGDGRRPEAKRFIEFKVVNSIILIKVGLFSKLKLQR